MSFFKIQAGAQIETASPAEVETAARRAFSAGFQEMAEGVKPMRFDATGNIATGAVTIPQLQSGQLAIGPSKGFTWAVQRISCFGLSSNDVLSVHRVVTDGSAFIGNLLASAGFLHIGGRGVLLRNGEYLLLTGTGLTATGQLLVNGEGAECPAFMDWKLVV